MRGLRLVWASIVGWFVDTLLTLLIVGTLFAILHIESDKELVFSNPWHVIVGIILPVLMTVIGGGVAGALASDDAFEAGALVGGWGLVLLLLDGVDQTDRYGLVWIVAQCVAVVAAGLAATLVARWRRRVK